MSRLTHKQIRVNVSARGQTCEQKLVDKRKDDKDDLEGQARKQEQETTRDNKRQENTCGKNMKP